MATYTQLSMDEVRQFASFFEIGPVVSFNPLDGGAANSSFHVRTQNNEYVLSVCDEKSLEEVDNLTKLLICLEENDFPTTRVVRSADKSAVTSYRGKPVFLKRYIEGKVQDDLNQDMLRELGRNIAKLHQVSSPEYLPEEFPYGVDFFSQVTDSDLDSKFNEWLKGKKREIEERFHADLPRGLVHGDIFYDNILFNESSLAAIIDFEEASDYYLVFDIGMCVIGTCAKRGRISLPKVRSLVEGYQNERKLSYLERESLQNFVQYGAVATAFWRFKQYNIVNPDKSKSSKFKEMKDLADNVASIDPTEFQEKTF